MEGTYRAERDGIAQHVQPTEIEAYAEAGYALYRPDGTRVTDISAEAASVEPQSYTMCIGGANG